MNCIAQKRRNLEGVKMKHFNHLETIRLSDSGIRFNDFHHERMRSPFKLLSVHGSKILSNVENLAIEYAAYDCDFLKFAPKLRYLHWIEQLKFSQLWKIFFIEIKFNSHDAFEFIR